MFVAINYISCQENYKNRFEKLFSTRAKAIDTMPGFQHMYVLKPNDQQSEYLIISHWESENHFKAWTSSEAFIEGHKRGFKDIEDAAKKGQETPMKSSFKTYEILTR